MYAIVCDGFYASLGVLPKNVDTGALFFGGWTMGVSSDQLLFAFSRQSTVYTI